MIMIVHCIIYIICLAFSGVGLVTRPLSNLGLPQPAISRTKEKKQKSKSNKPASISSTSNTKPTAQNQRSSGSGMVKSRENASTTYISTFPKGLQKMESLQSKSQNPRHSQSNVSADVFQALTPHLDPLEALMLTSPMKPSTSGFEHQMSRKNNCSPQEHVSSHKETKKLFQPFVSTDPPVSVGFVTKSNTVFTADSLLSPIKTGANKPPLIDVLSTPQKMVYHSNSENMFSSPPSLTSTSGSDICHFGIFQESEVASMPLDRKSDLPTKISPHDENISVKSQYFPGIMDPLNISPNTCQSARKKELDPITKMCVHQGSLDNSRSSSPIHHTSLSGEFVPSRANSPRSIVSPKISPALPSGVLDTDSASLPSKSHMFSGTAAEISPVSSVASTTTQAFVSSTGSNTGGVTNLASPAIDIAVNPLGTGYFNALTQKLIDPTFSLASDFNKPSTSGNAAGLDGPKGKSYFENGILINQDYDKISDTNDDDDLERFIDDIDTKSDNIDTKGYSEIEDLLNEFNEKQLEDMKNKSQLDDFMKHDDFLKTVIDDSSKSKTESGVKSDDANINPSEEFEMNKSITDILELEKERIDKESTEMENARLCASGLINTSTATSESVTVSSSTASSTVTSTSNTESKVSASADLEGKKEDDPVDFEIPKVGKLMKIRKYFQIQEQKRKEQTEKVSENKVPEKNETSEEKHEKPQTILVQVSKRKKIEYGPYLNRQSLLEGKPKTNVDTNSPPKIHRPKPKPPVAEKRTFNLRERKTKTDFATLATTGSRTPEIKKTETKQKACESSEKNINETEEENENKEDAKDEKLSEDEEKVAKIVTRNQENEKMKDVETLPEKNKVKTNKGSSKSGSEIEKDTENQVQQKDIKSTLRTRSAKNETENVDGKNLRKRCIKPSDTTDNAGTKVKVKKMDDMGQKTNVDTEEKVTRSKSKLKSTAEKSPIKKCSVNLGAKYTETCVKKQTEKTDMKNIDLIDDEGQVVIEEVQSKMEVDKPIAEQDTEMTERQNTETDNDIELIAQDALACSEATDIVKENEIVDGDPIVEKQNIEDKPQKGVADENDKRASENVDQKEINIFQKINRKGYKTRNEKNRRESNIFEQIDQTVQMEKKHSVVNQDETQMVRITSTDNTDKKVTMKLKLGPNFQKAFEMFNVKKRKYIALNESSRTSSIETETKKEQKGEKRFKDIVENGDLNEHTSEKKVEDSTCTDNEISIDLNNIKTLGDTNVCDDTIERVHEQTLKEEIETEYHQHRKKLKEDNEKEVNQNKINLKEDTEKLGIVQENNENDRKGIETIKSDRQYLEIDKNVDDSAECLKEEKPDKIEKKVKHSVENEFQRLVNEAMAEAQKEGDTGKSKNLRKRLNENVKYNVDESDDELDKFKLAFDVVNAGLKGQKGTPKSLKGQMKTSINKGKLKQDPGGMKDSELTKQNQAKKDMDVFDFTDTEMSDTDESTPNKLGFKPKYVSNLNLFCQKKLPFVSKPMSPTEDVTSEEILENVIEGEAKQNSDNEDADSGISYVGKTVEPLKIKLTKIIPFKEKRHKHKKKKRKREKERRANELEKIDSESRESIESGEVKKYKGIKMKISEDGCEFKNSEESCDIEKREEIEYGDSVEQESISNEGEDDMTENGNSVKTNKKAKLKEKKHLCEYCNVGFGQKCDLRRHVMIHTGERPYPCQICDKRFQRKTDLVKHTRTHTGEKPYACEFCDKRVSDKSQLNVHRRLHTGDRPYCCSKCGKRCITSTELSRHKAVCCGDMVERCGLCKKAFTIKECLGMHMKLHYRSRGKLFKCEKCAIGFDKKIDLDTHHCVDSMKNVYICSECYEEFSDEMLYAEHIKTHDLGVLACNVCTQIFEDKHSLETHLCNLGMDKPRHACDICDMEFDEPGKLFYVYT